MKSRSGSGFTLIELAIVIAIIGILAAVAVPRFANLTSNAQLAVAQSLLQSMQTSSAVYVAQQRKPPTAFSDFIKAEALADGDTQTLSLASVANELNGGTVPAIGGDTLKLEFTNGGTAEYKLNGSDVTMRPGGAFDTP